MGGGCTAARIVERSACLADGGSTVEAKSGPRGAGRRWVRWAVLRRTEAEPRERRRPDRVSWTSFQAAYAGAERCCYSLLGTCSGLALALAPLLPARVSVGNEHDIHDQGRGRGAQRRHRGTGPARASWTVAPATERHLARRPTHTRSSSRHPRTFLCDRDSGCISIHHIAPAAPPSQPAAAGGLHRGNIAGAD